MSHINGETHTTTSTKKVKKTPDEIADIFRQNVELLIKNLMAFLPNEAVLLGLVHLVLTKQMDKHKVIIEFIKHSHSFWKEIKEGNESFFLDENQINNVFGKLPMDKVLNFKQYWTELNAKEKDNVKQFFQTLVKYAEQYDGKVHITKTKID